MFKGKFEVLVSDGTRGRYYPVVEVTGYNEGFVYRYKNDKGFIDLVYASRDYRPLDLGAKYLIGKRFGNNSAAELIIEGNKVQVPVAAEIMGLSIDRDCPGEDLSALVRADFIGTGAKTLYGKVAIPWKWIIIGGIVAIIIFILFKVGQGTAEGSELLREVLNGY